MSAIAPLHFRGQAVVCSPSNAKANICERTFVARTTPRHIKQRVTSDSHFGSIAAGSLGLLLSIWQYRWALRYHWSGSPLSIAG